jgi:membrane protein
LNSTLARIRKIQSLLDEKEYLKQEQSKLPMWRRFTHFWLLVLNSFRKNRGPVRASSLAYTTLLALIPVLALIVSISTSFLQNDQQTINKLVDRFITTIAPQLNLIQQGDQEETEIKRADVTNRIMEYIQKMNSGALGVTAGLALVFVAVMLLSSVETAFNDFWGVTRGRTWAARFVQYWAAITLGPLFLITAVALTTGAQIQSAKMQGAEKSMKNSGGKETNLVSAPIAPNLSETNKVKAKEKLKEETKPFQKKSFIAKLDSASKWLLQVPILGFVILKLLPFVVLTLFVTFIYKLMPATRVRWSAAFIGGAVGGCLLQLNNLFSVIYLSKVVGYSKVYGSIGVIPIFLVGLYFSWLIVLFGAQVGYAWQNKQAYIQEKQAESINQRGREFVGLRIMTFVGLRFFHGEKPPTRLELTNQLGVPQQLANQILCHFVNTGLLVEVAGDETGFAPARPIEKISLEDILSALRSGQGTELATADDPVRLLIREEYERIVLAEMHTAGAVTLHTLVVRAENLPPRPHTSPAHTAPKPAEAAA